MGGRPINDAGTALESIEKRLQRVELRRRGFATTVVTSLPTYAQDTPPTGAISTGSIWYDTSSNNTAYRWDGSTWVPVIDPSVDAGRDQAAIDLVNAQDDDGSPDLHITTFIQASAPAVAPVGDLWVDTDNNRLYRSNGVSWVDTGDTSVGASIRRPENASTIADGKTQTWYANNPPTPDGFGDTWVDTSQDPMALYRWNNYNWVQVSGWSLAQVNSKLNTKITTFRQASIPTSTAVGDMWFDTSQGNISYRAAAVGATAVSSGQWVLTQDVAIPTAQETADAKIKTFYQDSVPTSISVGDIWYDTNDGNKQYRSMNVGTSTIQPPGSATGWVLVQDEAITNIGPDGDPPASSPAALLTGGIGTIFVKWEAISNADPVTYEVHIAQNDDAFVPVAGDTATLAATTPATSASIRTMPNGDQLLYTSVYTVRVIATDADGAAAPGAPSSGSMMAVTAADIAVDYVYANDILANQITGGTMNATVLLAGLFQTATSGGRTEVGPFGIRIYDANGIDINVDLNGLLNRFRGSIDATDIIIRDALQMFGKLNKMGAGAVLTMTSTTSAPAQAPTLSWEYAEQPRPGGGAYLSGAWWSADESQTSATELYYRSSWYMRQGVPYPMPNIVDGNGDTWGERMLWSHGRIAETAGSGLGVTYHEMRTAGSTAYPKLMVGVWDDAAVPGGGAPVLKGEIEFAPFSWFKQSFIAKRFGGSSKNLFSLVQWDVTAKTIDWRDYTYTTAGGLVLTGYSGAGALSVAQMSTGDKITGVVFGSTTALKIDDGGVPKAVIVVSTNRTNYVYQFNGTTYLLNANAAWRTTYGAQDLNFYSYDPFSEVITSYFSANWAAGVDQKIYRYENNHILGEDTWWVSYAWRGEATKAYKTEDSDRASIGYIRRARLRVSVPALPAPAAGIGAARDPNKDPYGWVYYMGHGLTEPPDALMYLQPVQPTMVPGVVLTDSSIAKSNVPTWGGSNPVITSSFPASSPAQIRSDGNDSGGDPLLSIDGGGHIRGQDLTMPTPLATALQGKAAEQLAFMLRSLQTLVWTGNRSVGFTDGKVIWGATIRVIGAGNHPHTASSGLFEIAFPAAGTSIPVHNSTVRTSVVSASNGIPLNPEETLWYELPLEDAFPSQPGRFHVLGWNSNDGFLPPPNWVMICSRFSSRPYFMWGDGERDSGWIFPSLINGWVQYASGSWDAMYRLHNGDVTMRGLVAKGSAPYTPIMFNLPTGFRPVYNEIFTTQVAGAGTPATLYVQANGDVYAAVNGAGTWTSLSGIHFIADQ